MSDMDALLKGGFQLPAPAAADDGGQPLDEEDMLLARINGNLKRLSPTGAAFARARMKSRWGWAPPTEEEAMLAKLETQKKIGQAQRDLAQFSVAQARGLILDRRKDLVSQGVDVDAALSDPEQFASVAQGLGMKGVTPGMLAIAGDPMAGETSAERTKKQLTTKAESESAATSLIKTRREVAAGSATNKAGEPISELGNLLAKGEEQRGIAPALDDKIDEAPGAKQLLGLADEIAVNKITQAFGGQSEMANMLVQRQGARVADQLKNLPTTKDGMLTMQGDAGVDPEAVFTLVSWLNRMATAQGKPLESLMGELGLDYKGVDEASYFDMAKKVYDASGSKTPFPEAMRMMLLGPWNGAGGGGSQ